MDKYVELVISTLNEIGEDDDNESLMNVSNETELFGLNGALDSMGVVFLITELEEKISDQFDVDLTLADERAMSRKTSPFRSVKTLAKYIDLLISEEKEG